MLPAAARRHYRDRQALIGRAQKRVRDLWGRMGDDFDESWAATGPAIQQTLVAAKDTAATSAIGYVTEVAGSTPEWQFDVAAFATVTEDGRTLDGLAAGAVSQARIAVGAGASTATALATAGQWLQLVTANEIRATSHAAATATVAATPTITGYVRMLNLPSCSDCIILAGKWFRWNEGFQRHKRCDCQHVPAAEDAAGDMTTDPYVAFNSMSASQQDRAFGRTEAQAIRDGGDIFRVVNLRNRGLGTARSNLKYGTPMRRTIDDIYAAGGTREQIIDAMREEGYITGPQTREGNIVGRRYERFSRPISRPIVAGSARDRVLTARRTGVRDPLDRATMTAAERRVYDAWYRLEYASRTGYLPRTIGLDPADRFVINPVRQRITPEVRMQLEEQISRELARLGRGPSSIRTLATALGLI